MGEVLLLCGEGGFAFGEKEGRIMEEYGEGAGRGG